MIPAPAVVEKSLKDVVEKNIIVDRKMDRELKIKVSIQEIKNAEQLGSYESVNTRLTDKRIKWFEENKVFPGVG